jgi:hypothetical protein
LGELEMVRIKQKKHKYKVIKMESGFRLYRSQNPFTCQDLDLFSWLVIITTLGTIYLFVLVCILLEDGWGSMRWEYLSTFETLDEAIAASEKDKEQNQTIYL